MCHPTCCESHIHRSVKEVRKFAGILEQRWIGTFHCSSKQVIVYVYFNKFFRIKSSPRDFIFAQSSAKNSNVGCALFCGTVSSELTGDSF